MRRILLGLCMLFFLNIHGQEIPLPEKMPQEHPRVLTTPEGKKETWKLIKKEAWAQDVFNKLKERTDVYTRRTESQPDWLLSRLAMYWKLHATEVYVKGEVFDHAGGEKAPAPTVRYTGTRGTAATHGRPKLEDIVPYDDNEDGNVAFCNNALEGRPLESVHPSKTGRNIENLNCEILGIARDAAFLYWMTGEEKYAKLFPSKTGMPEKPLRMALGSLLIQKMDLSLDEKRMARIEKMSFDAYNESDVLIAAVERYFERTGHYPERILADKIYRNRNNLAYCREHRIRLSGPSLGRPKKNAVTDRKTEYKDNADRIAVERAFALAKQKYGLGLITSRLDETTRSSIALSVIAMNVDRIN